MPVVNVGQGIENNHKIYVQEMKDSRLKERQKQMSEVSKEILTPDQFKAKSNLVPQNLNEKALVIPKNAVKPPSNYSTKSR